MYPISSSLPQAPLPLQGNSGAPQHGDNKLRETFDQFIGETFYGQMLKSLRSSTGKSAYFDGGRGEEIFRGQLDQVLAEKMAQANGGDLSGPMFELFQLSRQ